MSTEESKKITEDAKKAIAETEKIVKEATTKYNEANKKLTETKDKYYEQIKELTTRKATLKSTNDKLNEIELLQKQLKKRDGATQQTEEWQKANEKLEKQWDELFANYNKEKKLVKEQKELIEESEKGISTISEEVIKKEAEIYKVAFENKKENAKELKAFFEQTLKEVNKEYKDAKKKIEDDESLSEGDKILKIIDLETKRGKITTKMNEEFRKAMYETDLTKLAALNSERIQHEIDLAEKIKEIRKGEDPEADTSKEDADILLTRCALINK